MRVAVDLVRCQANGACARAAPDVFALGADGRAVVVDPEPGDDRRRAVAKAARRCPTQAVTVSR